ncbi:PIR Superfamily Protein [Plasmodium ovale wallikeri]|uniref:PIR Superfamily Protein n=1 Tax=Plasmodium ovale wallikeri TaxID=864142 RepID=A0A1A9AT43_PLAOA|nr:PIR Superfamily Protein [Plasmodium ovale wallikeri]SBT59426.1 PIR Superfamily Protein [Plasmodium ovale wallikeri]
MSPKGSKYTLNMFVEEDASLKETKLYKLYQKFDNVCDHSIGSPQLCSSDESHKSLDISIQELYKKLISNLKSISHNNGQIYDDITSDKNELYTYLKYWFYDHIIKEDINGPQINDILKAWSKEKEESCADCKCEFNIKFLSQIEQIKRIYDYSLFYEKYKIARSINEKIYRSKYCKYLEGVNIHYTMLEESCTTTPNKLECKEFNNYIKNYIKVDNSLTISCPEEASLDDRSPGARSPVSTLHGDEAEKRGLSRSTGEIEGLPEGFEIMGEEEDKSVISAIVSFSLVGAFLILFFFYKFTPILSYLRSRTQRKKGMRTNVNAIFNEFIMDESKFEQMDSDDRGYNVTYQSY